MLIYLIIMWIVGLGFYIDNIFETDPGIIRYLSLVFFSPITLPFIIGMLLAKHDDE